MSKVVGKNVVCSKVVGKNVVCSKAVGISKVLGASWPNAFLGIGMKHCHDVTAIDMPAGMILTNGRPCALHARVSISLTTGKCRHRH